MSTRSESLGDLDMTTPYPPPPRKKKVRVFTWIIVAINVLFAVWLIGGIATAASKSGTSCNGLDQKTCEAAQGIGATIGAGLILFLWVAVDVILGVIWLVTRKKEPAVIYLQAPPPAGGV